MAKVIEIIEKYLRENGYDGLAGDECGCEIGELACCDEGIPSDCEAAHKVYCKDCKLDFCPYDSCPGKDDTETWCMRSGKPDAAESEGDHD